MDKGYNKFGFLSILTIYIALKPLYLWSSGSLQICDLFLLSGFVYVIISKGGKIRLNHFSCGLMELFLVLVLYQAIINGIWSHILDVNISKATLYYTYNMFSVFLTLLILQDCSHQKVSAYVLVGCFISLLITNFGIFLGLGGVRKIGFFNNPNQLGYHALIILSMFSYYYKSAKPFLKVSIAIMSLWALLASGSKAAFFGAGILIFLHLLFEKDRKGKTNNKLLVQIALLILIILLLYILFFSNSSLIQSNQILSFVRHRMLSVAEENDSALGTSRGYNRIWELGTNFLWGMGEGDYFRFATMNGLEAHSSYVTQIVSYGLLGMIGYTLLIWKFISYRPCIRNNLIILSGIIAYGVTHNGLRYTLLWILLTIMFSQRWINEKQDDKAIANTAIL